MLSVLMLVSVVHMMGISVSADTATVTKSFTDVKEGKWYYDGVMWCYENGYMEGESDSIFAPPRK